MLMKFRSQGFRLLGVLAWEKEFTKCISSALSAVQVWQSAFVSKAIHTNPV